MSRRTYECWGCHGEFASATDHAIHVSRCRDLGGPVAGPVHCWACAYPIDLRRGTLCPSCGRDYAEGEPGAIEVVIRHREWARARDAGLREQEGRR